VSTAVSRLSKANSAQLSLFWEDPATFFGESYTNAHSIPREELESMQLAGLQQRFGELAGQIPFLEKLVSAQGNHIA